MAYGKLTNVQLVAATDTDLYTVASNCKYADVTINMLNTGVTDAVVNIAISAGTTPSLNEYLEKGVVIPADGGVLERTNILCDPSEHVVVRSDTSDIVVRVSGKEVV